MDKTLLILGAGSDIAQACAYEFAKNEHHLILAARNCQKLAPLQSDLKLKHNIQVSLAEFDALDYTNQEYFAKEWGSKADSCLLAFGYLGAQEKAEIDWNEARQIAEINYLGAVLSLQAIANVFEEKKKGCIIGISSVAGERGRKSNYIYGSAKAGFSIFLDGLRNRLYANNVHVISVKPGFVDTKMTAHLPLPKTLTANPNQVAKSIFNAYKKRKNTVYVWGIWRYIMLIIKFIPEFIFKKLNL